MQIIKKIFKFFFALTIALIIVHSYIAEDLVLLSEPSLNNKWIAQVVVKRNAFGLSVDSYLVVRIKDNLEVIKQYPLVMARDAVQDVTTTVHSIVWENEIIKVDIQSQHYSGPKQFSANN